MDKQQAQGPEAAAEQDAPTTHGQAAADGNEALSDQELDTVSGGLNAISESADTGGWSPPSQNNWGLSKPITRRK